MSYLRGSNAALAVAGRDWRQAAATPWCEVAALRPQPGGERPPTLAGLHEFVAPGSVVRHEDARYSYGCFRLDREGGDHGQIAACARLAALCDVDAERREPVSQLDCRLLAALESSLDEATREKEQLQVQLADAITESSAREKADHEELMARQDELLTKEGEWRSKLAALEAASA
jgi:hypothetical protein